ncbi:uncharacterized protein LOC111327860 [Stylophora pistillata]|uniref:Suppressor APC domain-containing protein 2 n=1 Tax=Stylophora pistillata TaxID=50429 RepID=A0A2B4SDX6_STYPI|nr:uncharacterized protein LOC111327860 [Stylophora pistillata]PFX27253.1 Suppressor APC domain-containing protein 2 [Stylophora pistillata]
MSASPMDTRQVGRHVFIFSKQNGSENPPTIIAKPVNITQDLPREFLRYLKTLFDILDEKGTGFVRLADIETRWKTKQGSNGLGEGVIESLRKVTPKNGLLSFERLCTGMKLALKTQPRAQTNGSMNGLDHSTRRSNSLPQLDTATKGWTSDSSEDSFAGNENRTKAHVINKLRDRKDESQEKRRSLTINTSNQRTSGNDSSGSASPSSANGSPKGRSNSTTKVYFVGKEISSSVPANLNGHIKHPAATTEIQNFDKDARLQELDDEHDLLQNGLQVIEKARKWYFKRITAIQEEKLHLQNGDQYSLEQFQYELLLHKTRRRELGLDDDSFKEHKHHIQSVNQSLERIIEGKAPVKASPTSNSDANNERQRLQDEVERLKKEVSEKGGKIAQLETEKSALIRDLFNSKASGKNGLSTKKPHQIF